jgi:hypothetical protein
MNARIKAIVDGLQADIDTCVARQRPFYPPAEEAHPLAERVVEFGNIIAGAATSVARLKVHLSEDAADESCDRYCKVIEDVFDHVFSFTELRDLGPVNAIKALRISREIQLKMNSFSTLKGVRSCPEITPGHDVELAFAKIYLATLRILNQKKDGLIEHLPRMLRAAALKMLQPNEVRERTVEQRIQAEEGRRAHVTNPSGMFAHAGAGTADVELAAGAQMHEGAFDSPAADDTDGAPEKFEAP